MKSLLEAVCSLCLASSAMMHWEGCSILFFGEYPFPEKVTKNTRIEAHT